METSNLFYILVLGMSLLFVAILIGTCPLCRFEHLDTPENYAIFPAGSLTDSDSL